MSSLAVLGLVVITGPLFIVSVFAWFCNKVEDVWK